MTRARIADNPFLVLELAPDCSRIEIERAGQKLLAMLEVGLGDADRYETPFGPRPRTPELVREAMAALRDPRRRLVAEMWARPGAAGAPPPADDAIDDSRDDEPGWPRAMQIFGLGRSG
jgi:hypothetical protein